MADSSASIAGGPFAEGLRWIRAPDRFGIVFLALLVSFTLLGLSEEGRWLRLVIGSLLGLTIVFTLATSQASRRSRRMAAVVVLVAMAVTMTEAIVGQHLLPVATYLSLGFVTLAVPYFVLARLLQHEVVSIETLLGAAVVYLLIGLAFTFLLLGAAFWLGPDFLRGAEREPADYMYLSFITLTTVGFGDITPGTDLARVMIVIEALLAQLFLATVIARLASVFQRRDRRVHPDRAPGASDPRASGLERPSS